MRYFASDMLRLPQWIVRSAACPITSKHRIYEKTRWFGTAVITAFRQADASRLIENLMSNDKRDSIISRDDNSSEESSEDKVDGCFTVTLVDDVLF